MVHLVLNEFVPGGPPINEIPGGPPIAENVLNFLDSALPSGPPIIPGPPPIREGAVADLVHLTLDDFQPSPPPIHEGFTDGLHDIIDFFKFDDVLHSDFITF